MKRVRVLAIMTLISVMLLGISASIQNVRGQGYFFDISIYTVGFRAPIIEYYLEDFKEIGINAKLETMEANVLEDTLNFRREPAAEGGWDLIYWPYDLTSDPDFSLLYHSRNMPPEGWGDATLFNNGKSDRLLDEGVKEFDFDARKEIYDEWQEIVYEELPIIPNFQIQGLTIARNTITGVDAYADWIYAFKTDHSKLSQFVDITGTGKETFVHATPFKATANMPIFGYAQIKGGFDSLTYINPDYEVIPALAESWDVSEDKTTITFHLRQGVVWSDGEPFTSKDVLMTFNAILDPDTGAIRVSEMDAVIDSMEAPDDNTFVFQLKYPYVPFLMRVGWDWGIDILPWHILKDVPFKDWIESDYNTKAGLLPSLGPYRLIEVGAEHEYRLWERNDLYWGWGQNEAQPVGKAPEKVEYRYIPEPATALAAYEAGDIDFLYMYYKLQDQYDDLQTRLTDTKFYLSDTGFCEGFAVNLNTPVLQSKYVRQALSHAMNRERFIDEVYNGVCQPTSIPIMVGSPYLNTDLENPHPYDIEEAKSLMEKAGYDYAWLTAAETSWITLGATIAGGFVIGVVITFIAFKLRKR